MTIGNLEIHDRNHIATASYVAPSTRETASISIGDTHNKIEQSVIYMSLRGEDVWGRTLLT